MSSRSPCPRPPKRRPPRRAVDQPAAFQQTSKGTTCPAANCRRNSTSSPAIFPPPGCARSPRLAYAGGPKFGRPGGTRRAAPVPSTIARIPHIPAGSTSDAAGANRARTLRRCCGARISPSATGRTPQTAHQEGHPCGWRWPSEVGHRVIDWPRCTPGQACLPLKPPDPSRFPYRPPKGLGMGGESLLFQGSPGQVGRKTVPQVRAPDRRPESLAHAAWRNGDGSSSDPGRPQSVSAAHPAPRLPADQSPDLRLQVE